MTDPQPSPGVQRRLELIRHRRASMAADRAAFEARRHHGLTCRHEAKLAHLSRRDHLTPEPAEEVPPDEQPQNDAA